MAGRREEAGYALVAAVASILLFSILALTVLQLSIARSDASRTELDRARVAAAADAGLVLAIKGLLADDVSGRWPIDGRPLTQRFGDATLTIRISDERGKVPINRLDDAQLDILLAVGGLSGQRRDIARDSLQDWVDDDEDARPDGAERDYYEKLGIVPRDGNLSSVEELARVRGWDRDVIARIRGIVSVDFGDGAFVADSAEPGALRVMTLTETDSPASIQRAREAAGQVTALTLPTARSLKQRPLLVTIEARLPDRGQLTRHAIVELTGERRRPYLVKRYY
jgi:general secretion pathway protein K